MEKIIIYAIILMICAIACIVLAIYMWSRRPARGALWMTSILVTLIFWLLFYLLELFAPSEESKYFFYRLTFLSKTLLPVIWLGFALRYAKLDRFITKRNIFLFMIFPFFANIGIWIIDINGPMWTGELQDVSIPFTDSTLIPNVLFWAGAIYCYIQVVMGAIIIIRNSIIQNEFDKNAWIIMAAVIVSMFVNAGTALRPDLVNYLEVTPVVFTVCLCTAAWFVFRHRVMDLVPIARDRLIEQMRDGMIVVDMGGYPVYQNNAARSILAGAANDTGKLLENKLPCCRDLSEMVDSTKVINMATNNGGSSYYEVQTSVLHNADNSQGGYLISMHDFTERKIHEEQLQQYRNHLEELVKQRTIELESTNSRLTAEVNERMLAVRAANASEEKYRILVENASQAIVVVQDGFLKFVNPKTLELTGYTEEELKSRYFLEIVSVEDRDVIASHYLRKLSNEIISEISPVRMKCKNGEIKWVELNVAAISWQGKPAVLNFLNDITERRLAEEKVRSSYEKLKNAMNNTIKVMSSIIELKDPYTAGHQSRVTELACAIAIEMDLSRQKVDGLRASSLVHDIGKITIPAEILSKPGALNEIEFVMIKKHSTVGYDILKQIDFDWPIAEIVLQHHERINGSGYPHGLTGDKMMLESKILAVADVIEAMSSHRPYRPSLGIEKALEEVSNNRGVLYDPAVVDTCTRIFREKAFTFA